MFGIITELCGTVYSRRLPQSHLLVRIATAEPCGTVYTPGAYGSAICWLELQLLSHAAQYILQALTAVPSVGRNHNY